MYGAHDTGLYKSEEMGGVTVVAIVTVVEVDPKEIQNDSILWCFYKLKGECPSPTQGELSVYPELC